MKTNFFGWLFVFLLAMHSFGADKTESPPKQRRSPITRGGLKISRIEELVNEGVAKIDTVTDKNIILVLGNTGAGKSATINYLLGGAATNTGDIHDPEVTYLNPLDERAKIGQNCAESETTFPQSYDNEATTIYNLCDTPGFLETRGRDEEVIVAASRKAAIKRAGEIKAIVVVIDYQTIRTDKARGLVELSKQLAKLIKNPQKLHNSILFIITKAPSLTLVNLKKNIDAVKKARNKEGENLLSRFGSFLNFQDSEQKEDTDREIEINKGILSVLNLFELSDYNNIAIIDIFDSLKSKEEIEKKISGLKPVPISSFNFDDYDTESTKFDEALIQIIEDKISYIDARNKIVKAIEDKKNKISDLAKNVAAHENSIKELDEYLKLDEKTRIQNKNNLLNQIQEKKAQVAKMKDARFFYMKRIPENEALKNYKNSYLILPDKKVYYLGIDDSCLSVCPYSLINESVIGELKGEKALNYTFNSSERDVLLRIVFGDRSFSKEIRFLKECPGGNSLDSYKNTLIITKNSQNDTEFMIIDENKNMVNVAKKIPRYFKNKLKKFRLIEENIELNELLANEQLVALYRLCENDMRSDFLGTAKLLEGIIDEIKNQQKALLSEKEALLWRDEIKEKRSFVGWLFSAQTTKNFTYTVNQPFVRCKETPKQCFTQRIENKEKGIYSSLYTSKPAEEGNAKVKIYIKERDLPENIALRKILDEELKEYVRKLNLMKSRIGKFEEEVGALELAHLMYDNEGRRAIEISRLKNLIQEKNDESNKLKSQIVVLQDKLQSADALCANILNTLSNCFFYVTSLGLYDKTFYIKATGKYNNYRANHNTSSLAMFKTIFDLHKSLSINPAGVSHYKEKVLAAAKEGLNLHELDDKGSNIIHYLVQDGLEKLLSFYHNQQVSLTIRNAHGESPLDIAVRLGNLSALEQFEVLNISLPEQIMPDGNTLLHNALFNKRKDIFLWLLNRVNKNKVNKAGLTAFQIALQQRDEDSMRLLLRAGGLEISRDDDAAHYNGLYKAIDNNNVPAVKLMVQYADREVFKQALNTPFSEAKFNHFFVEKKDDPFPSSSDGELPLACAVRKGNKQIIELLLKMRSPYEKLDAHGNNILHIAAEHAGKEILELLWQYLETTFQTAEAKKRYVNQCNNNGFAPIHIAIEKGNIDAVDWFLANKLVDKSRSTKDNKKYSLVHLALSTRNEAIAEKLIEAHGMDLRTMNSAGFMPIEFATHMKMSKAKGLIKDKLFNPFQESIRRYLDEKLKLIKDPALKGEEREFLINTIVSRISDYLKQDNSQAKELKKLIIKREINHKEFEGISRIFLEELTNILAGNQKRILFRNLNSASYSQIDDMLPRCFKPLLSSVNKQNEAPAIDPKSLFIPEKEVQHLKKKGFCRALGQSLHYLYYVHQALVEGEVDPKSSKFTSAASVYNAFSPLIAGKVNQEVGDTLGGAMKVNLAFTLVNGFFLLVREYEKQQAINAAQRVVDAFGSGIMIDVDSVKAITEAFYERYKDQIHQMSMSISTGKKLRLHDRDGVVQFANVIAMRIGNHILQDRNRIIGESNVAICRGFHEVAKFVNYSARRMFGEVQNLTADKPMPILPRCMLAMWNEIDGMENKVELDAIEGTKNKIWMAGNILTQTGYRLIEDNQRCYARKGYFDKDIGFCYVTMEEVKKRGDYEEVATPLDYMDYQ